MDPGGFPCYQMDVPASGKRTELLVGVFLFIGLAMLAGLIVRFGRFDERFGRYYQLTVVFDDATGVIKGSDVLMGGARIGKVASAPQLNDAVKVEVELDIEDRIEIPMGSSFQISSATLLGDKLVVIVPPVERTGGFIGPGSRISGAGPTGLDALQNNAEVLSRDVMRMMEKTGRTIEKIDAAVEDIRVAADQVREAVAKVNQSILAEENLTRFDTTLENLTEVSGQWKRAGNRLEPVLDETREAITSLKDASVSAKRTLDHADETIASLKPAFESVPGAVGEISRTARKAGDALDRMEDGKGLLGAVANDDEVSTDAKAFVKNLRRHGILRYRNDKEDKEDDPRDRFRGTRR